MKRQRLFRLKLELEEALQEEEILIPIFDNSQICSGIEQIKSTLDSFNNRIIKFIDDVLIPLDKQK